MKDYRLVYSTDPKLNERCKGCKELTIECRCAKEGSVPDTITVQLRIEKAQRGGKTVTVIRGLPAISDYLKTLAKELKARCGTGGTHGIEDQSGYIEIQGDKRDTVREFLQKKNIVVKG